MNTSVTAGLYTERFLDRCPVELIDDPFSCDHDYFSDASTLMKCIGIKNVIPVLLNFSSNTDQLDIFPFLFVVDDAAFNESISTPMVISEHHFITNGGDQSEAVSINPRLLFKPLQWNTWLVTIFILLFCFSLLYITIRLFNPNANVVTVTLLQFIAESCFCALIMGLYVSHLMAIVNVKPKPKDPFKNIEELTRLVEKGEKTLVTDNFEIMFVWWVLSGKERINDEYPESLQKLYNATRNNPSLEIPSKEEICEQLMLNSSLVYLGRLSDIEQYCSQYCFFRLPIPDIPLVFRSYSVSSKSSLIEPLNLCIDFMRTYTTTKVRRSKKWAITTCKHELQSNFITFQSVMSAIWILVCGFVFSVTMLLSEKYIV